MHTYSALYSSLQACKAHVCILITPETYWKLDSRWISVFGEELDVPSTCHPRVVIQELEVILGDQRISFLLRLLVVFINEFLLGILILENILILLEHCIRFV